MQENKDDERRLMAAGFMFYGALASFIAGLIFLLPYKWHELAPVGALPFFVGAACYLGFAIRLRRGDRQPVVNLKEFAWGNFLLAGAVFMCFRSYGKYIGYFGDDPGSYSDVFRMALSLVLLIAAIVTLRGKKKTEAVEASGEEK